MTGRVNPNLDIAGILDGPLSLGKGLLRGDVDILTLDGLKGILGLSGCNVQGLELIPHAKGDVLGLGNRSVADNLSRG